MNFVHVVGKRYYLLVAQGNIMSTGFIKIMVATRINVAIPVGKKNWRIKMVELNTEWIKNDAKKVMMYDARMRLTGGYDLKAKPSSYGLIFKWVLGQKKITYDAFAKKLNGTTRQNINHLFNRVPKERFFDEDIDDMCTILGITRQYFDALTIEVEKLMEE